jgi:hypothetical protein
MEVIDNETLEVVRTIQNLVNAGNNYNQHLKSFKIITILTDPLTGVGQTKSFTYNWSSGDRKNKVERI